MPAVCSRAKAQGLPQPLGGLWTPSPRCSGMKCGFRNETLISNAGYCSLWEPSSMFCCGRALGKELSGAGGHHTRTADRSRVGAQLRACEDQRVWRGLSSSRQILGFLYHHP